MPAISYPIITSRLRLRPFSINDVDDVYAYQRREDVARFQLWTERDREEMVTKVSSWVSMNGEGDKPSAIVLVVELVETGRVIGDLFLGLRDHEARQGEIGYTFNPDFHGQGYATEAVRALMALGFGPLKLHRLYGRCDVRNEGSWRLMERLKMRREAHFREHALFKGEWDEELYYAILEDEWRSLFGGKADGGH